jgi:hypothetical protein
MRQEIQKLEKIVKIVEESTLLKDEIRQRVIREEEKKEAEIRERMKRDEEEKKEKELQEIKKKFLTESSYVKTAEQIQFLTTHISEAIGKQVSAKLLLRGTRDGFTL